jgi:hypothetical protein
MGFEQWWSARAALVHDSMLPFFYEGLALSIVLDNLHDPNVWVELAARRWYTLTLHIHSNMKWEMARALFPLRTVGGLPADHLYEMQKYAKAQEGVHSTMGGKRNNNKRWDNKKSGNSEESTASSGKDAPAKGGKGGNKKGGRSNENGTGAQSGAASAGNP